MYAICDEVCRCQGGLEHGCWHGQVNDMEYRIETWTLTGLHETNELGSQFPIGKEEQIRRWKQKDLKAFHEKWRARASPHKSAAQHNGHRHIGQKREPG